MLIGLISGDWSIVQNLVIVLAFALSIMIALVLHEVAHAWVAFKQGDPSAKMAGRISLNPARHIEPLGLLCFCIAGIGWAKPVPVNPFNYRNFKRGNFFVSISGVTINLILGFIFSFGLFLLIKLGSITSTGGGWIIGNAPIWEFGLFFFLFFATVINIALMVFNLLPVPPLDGYNMLVSFTKPNNSFMRFMRENAMIVLIVIIIFGSYFMGPVRDFIFSAFESFWGVFL